MADEPGKPREPIAGVRCPTGTSTSMTYELIEHAPVAARMSREVDSFSGVVDPDAELVSRWQAGDASAFEALVRQSRAPGLPARAAHAGQPRGSRGRRPGSAAEPAPPRPSLPPRVALLDLRLPRDGQRRAQPAPHARPQPRARARARRARERRLRPPLDAARSGRRRGRRRGAGARAGGAPGAVPRSARSPSCCSTSKGFPTARSRACSRCRRGRSSRASTARATRLRERLRAFVTQESEGVEP